ncbi:lipopolysaccharide biosynthesis protein [Sphingomonas bacterium]|uniref:lipopolysaccharide biosynthesis protein n=1 Tax=Sphingomonas bacterium TaxID=1895847 RepID=UPI0020C6070A|nr:lipopolysaccharide biosynthesis protein [Sphingomonas bacterium]
MNMHGIMVPATEDREPKSGAALLAWVQARKSFLLFVVLPTLLVAGYYYLIAARQYESEAHFLVRSAGQQQMPGIGISQALSAATGISSAQGEAMSVADYLTSHDAVATLSHDTQLVKRFQHDGVDPLARLYGDPPSPERLLKYFRNQVTVKYNAETGITTLVVHSFTPQDSYDIVEKMLEMGEARVNVLNRRSYADSIAMAGRQLRDTENELSQTQIDITRFRKVRSDIDPKALGNAQIGIVSTLTSDLASARAQLAAMGRMINHTSPQYQALAARVSALQAQLSAQSGRLTGNNSAIVNDISGYETLQMRQEFLSKRYEAAAAALEKARDQAQRQQLYVVRVVEPNMSVKALFPERGKIVLTVAVALLILYALGWLIVAGMREHAA